MSKRDKEIDQHMKFAEARGKLEKKQPPKDAPPKK
jgi:hypothetical protein